MNSVPRALSIALPDAISLDYSFKFQIDFPASGTGSRYFHVIGGAYRTEVVPASATLTLPLSGYYTDIVTQMPTHYAWVEIESTTIKYLPASFHTGSSTAAFGRNQCLVANQDAGYSISDDISQASGVAVYRYDQPFQLSCYPARYARQNGCYTKIKSGFVTSPGDFQYEGQGQQHMYCTFSRPKGPAFAAGMGDIYVQWKIRFYGRRPA